jgi:tetratricopeptide (TPR) repeat protein
MAERVEEPGADPEDALDQASPAAVALALGRASRDGAGKSLDAEASAFLRDHRRLINLQTEHLHEQRLLQLAHLQVRRWKDRLSLALQGLGVVFGLAVIVTLAVLAWQAHEDHGLVVEAFSAPPSFVQRGVSGEVVAADVVDKLSTMVAIARARSFSSTSGVSADAAKEVKIEIPETGVSLGEAWRLMRDWLGSGRKVTGDLRETGDGRIALTARVAGGEAFTATGAPSDLDKLEQQIAERLYGASDPVNIVIYYWSQGRKADAMAAAARNAATAHGRLDRADAFALWGETDDPQWEMRLARIALAIDPGLLAGNWDLVDADLALGHDQAAFDTSHRMLTLQDADQPLAHRGAGAAEMRAFARATAEGLTGDFAAASTDFELYGPGDVERVRRLVAIADEAARRHDPAAAEAMLAEATASGTPGRYHLLTTRYDLDVARGDWRAALNDAQDLVAAADGAFAASSDPDEKAGLEVASATHYRPMLAEAKAQTGDLAGAAALIAASPLDCYDCLLRRGRIAALSGDAAGAQHWFGEAARQGPSLPFAYLDWGRFLLASGRPDEAIARLAAAHALAPHFADPLELWGEALLRKGDAKGAISRLDEAHRLAPAWDRVAEMRKRAVTLAR